MIDKVKNSEKCRWIKTKATIAYTRRVQWKRRKNLMGKSYSFHIHKWQNNKWFFFLHKTFLLVASETKTFEMASCLLEFFPSIFITFFFFTFYELCECKKKTKIQLFTKCSSTAEQKKTKQFHRHRIMQRNCTGKRERKKQQQNYQVPFRTMMKRSIKTESKYFSVNES